MSHLALIANSSLQVAGGRIEASWTWYIIRAAGFTTAGLMGLLILSGIGQVTGLTYRFIEPLKAWVIHKALAFALIASIAVHAGFLLIDHFMQFSLPQILVPFVSHYNNGTTLLGLALGTEAVGMGILATYGIVIIVASSLGWIETKRSVWRKLHYISYLVAAFVFMHALLAGSDLKYGTFRTGWMLLGAVLVVGGLVRLRHRGSTRPRA